MYVSITVQHSCKIKKNILKLLMSYLQEIVGGYHFWLALYTYSCTLKHAFVAKLQVKLE